MKTILLAIALMASNVAIAQDVPVEVVEPAVEMSKITFVRDGHRTGHPEYVVLFINGKQQDPMDSSESMTIEVPKGHEVVVETALQANRTNWRGKILMVHSGVRSVTEGVTFTPVNDHHLFNYRTSVTGQKFRQVF